MKRNRDDRSDNVERIQENIDHTIRNMELAEEMIEEAHDDKTKKEITEKTNADKMRLTA